MNKIVKLKEGDYIKFTRQWDRNKVLSGFVISDIVGLYTICTDDGRLFNEYNDSITILEYFDVDAIDV